MRVSTNNQVDTTRLFGKFNILVIAKVGECNDTRDILRVQLVDCLLYGRHRVGKLCSSAGTAACSLRVGSNDTNDSQLMLFDDRIWLDVECVHCRVVCLKVGTDDWERQISEKFGEFALPFIKLMLRTTGVSLDRDS